MNKIEDNFIPYEEALALKELGFDELCLGRFDPLKVLVTISRPENNSYYKGSVPSFLATPLYQQAFKFFRERYNLETSYDSDIIEDENNNENEMWDFFIYKAKQKGENKIMSFCSNNFDTYIESFSKKQAELECLRQLIKIVKEK